MTIKLCLTIKHLLFLHPHWEFTVVADFLIQDLVDKNNLTVDVDKTKVFMNVLTYLKLQNHDCFFMLSRAIQLLSADILFYAFTCILYIQFYSAPNPSLCHG